MDLSESSIDQKLADLEVTGISQRGRIRKKTWKLMDVKSNENVSGKENKNNNQQEHLRTPKRNDPIDKPGTSGHSSRHGVKSGKKTFTKSPLSKKKVQLETSDNETTADQVDSKDSDELNDDESLSDESQSKDDTLTIDERQTRFEKLEPLYKPGKKGKNKKVNINDGGENGGARNKRKDKGKPRFTAYMLWSKESRQKLTEQYPKMDFATISKRLGETWATVPSLEKCLWARRAKRLVENPNSQFALKDDNMWKVPAPTLSNKFINKSQNLRNERSSMTQRGEKLVAPSTVSDLEIVSKEMTEKIGIKPIDVAAHLTLLGESLIAIGDLLTNHNGNISISGSLSILLDSLLCALSAVICLTQEVPETDGADPQTLSNMLDNVAYIMPGI